uniref:Uncharacterized protein n=1 Tax=Theileria parva TaxID=5875 RepID=Q4N056_THEPA|eukprot:XP_763316.1 hypothetical protein [Theileria parva strain Muguga]
MCSIKFYRIILITIVFVRCADKPGNNDQSLVSYTDSEEEEDNFNVTESAGPSKSSETTSFKHFEAYNKIIFIKKNEEGIMVPMEEGDYKVTSEDLSKIEYMFQASLEMIVYNYENIFEHVTGKPYALTLTYYKDYNVLTMQDVDGFTFMRREGGRWRVYSRRRSGYLELYKIDKGKEVELNEDDYYVTFGPKGLLKYGFKKNRLISLEKKT